MFKLTFEYLKKKKKTFGFDEVGEKNNFISIRGTCIDCSQILFLRYADQMRERDLPAKSGRDVIACKVFVLFCFGLFLKESHTTLRRSRLRRLVKPKVKISLEDEDQCNHFYNAICSNHL